MNVLSLVSVLIFNFFFFFSWEKLCDGRKSHQTALISLHVLCSGVVLLVVHCIQGVTRVSANTERGEGTCNSNTHVLYTYAF